MLKKHDIPSEVASEQSLEASPEPLLVRTEVAAKLLSLSRSLVYELMNQGLISYIKIGSARRVVVSSLHEFISKHQQ